MKIFVDGELERTAAGPAGVRNASSTLQIGKIVTGSNYVTGLMDEVKLYNYPLSDLEVARAYYTVTGQSVCLKSAQPSFDLNNDCKVDLGDFALLVEQWMDCALVPDCIE